MTRPVATTQSGTAADAVRTLQSALSGDYSEMRSAEIQLTEAILSAHAVTVSGRAQLQDIQRQLIEAITNPDAALGTPAGERQFLMFLRSKISEIQTIVDAGALTDEDHARLTHALASGYLLSPPTPDGALPPAAQAAGTAGSPTGDQAAGALPALGSALGALPQAAQGAAAAPAQGASGLAGAAAPLAGLASGLLGHGSEEDAAEDRAEAADRDERQNPDESDDSEHPNDSATDTDAPDARPAEPGPRGNRAAPEDGPAQTRPARLL